MTALLSVTEVRNALRCPRVFALGRRRGQQVSFPLGASCLGSAFHRIVEAFARSAANPPPELRRLPAGTELGVVRRQVSAWLVDLLVREIEQSPTYLTMPSEVDDLAEALRGFGDYVVRSSAVEGLAPSAAIARFLNNAELTLEVQVPLASGSLVTVSGRVDAVHLQPSGDLQVVEYKLTEDANEDIDRAQVALYRHLLQRQRSVDAAAVILRFNPALTKTSLEPKAADALVRKRILPLLEEMVKWSGDPSIAPATPRSDLCPVCPMRAPCQEVYRDRLAFRDDPPASGVRPRPEPAGDLVPAAPVQATTSVPPNLDDPEGKQEALALREAILKVLRDHGIGAESQRPPQVGPRTIRIDITAARGSVKALDRAAEDVKHHLHADLARLVDYHHEGGLRYFSAERKTPRAVELGKLLDRASQQLAARPGRFIVGERMDGSPLTGDLSDSASCHLLVAGTTGSGKSVLLRSVVTSLVHFHSPSAIRVSLIDPKRVSFAKLASSIAAHLAGPLCVEAEQALPLLSDLVEEMHERYRLFESEQVSDLDEFNESKGEADRLARHVVVVDEFQDLLADKATKADFVHVVTRLGAKARAAGIHLILATQRPTKDNVPTTIKANLPGKIALQVTSTMESRVVLDQAGAEALLGRGDLLAALGSSPVRAQSPLA
jgi:S-DNA-T family DNA segregation ATPase FtsK/SpoIIIE